MGECRKDKNIDSYKVKDDGVYKVMKNRKQVKMEPQMENIEAYEGDFHRPTRTGTFFGKSYALDFINKTEEKINLVSGRSRSFSVLGLDPVSDRATPFMIQKNHAGDYSFGLAIGGPSDGTYWADMYTVPSKGIKLIEIEYMENNAGYNVIPTSSEGNRNNPLLKKKTKTFREADKNFWRDTLVKAGIAVTAGATAGAIGGLVSGAIGGVVGGVMGGETDLAGVGDVVDNPTGQSDDMTVHPAASEQPIEYTEVPPTPVENGHGEAAPEANPHDDNPAGDDVSAEMPEPIEDGIQENISEECNNAAASSCTIDTPAEPTLENDGPAEMPKLTEDGFEKDIPTEVDNVDTPAEPVLENDCPAEITKQMKDGFETDLPTEVDDLDTPAEPTLENDGPAEMPKQMEDIPTEVDNLTAASNNVDTTAEPEPLQTLARACKKEDDTQETNQN